MESDKVMTEERGIQIAKGIRSCSTMFFVPVIGIATGVGVGQSLGWCLGILSGIAAFLLSSYGLKCLINRTVTGLSISDCLLPIIVSLVCAVVFLPAKWISANLFGSAECIISGVILSIMLLAYRGGRIVNPWWLVPSFLTFFYEILPINLPTDMDDILALSASGILSLFAVVVNGDKSLPLINSLIKRNRQKQLESPDAT